MGRAIGELTQATQIKPDDLFLMEQDDDAKSVSGQLLTKYVQDSVGKIFRFKGNVSSVSDLPQTAAVGDAYIISGTYEGYSYNGTEWLSIGTISASMYADEAEDSADAAATSATNAATSATNAAASATQAQQLADSARETMEQVIAEASGVIVVDPTLVLEGAAADAKAVGDALSMVITNAQIDALFT